MPIDSITITPDTIVSLLYQIAIVLGFAGLGGLYAFTGYRKQKQSNPDAEWDWQKAKTVIGAGAAAGVAALLYGGSVGGEVWWAVFGMAPILFDQLREIWSAGAERYHELADEQEEGVYAMDDILLESVRHAADEGNPEAILRRMQQFEQEHGRPDPKNVSERADGIKEADGGLWEQMYDELPDDADGWREPAEKAEGRRPDLDDDDGETATENENDIDEGRRKFLSGAFSSAADADDDAADDGA